MTEADWLACTDLREMLHYLLHRGSHRKQRLFACAQARRLWDRFPDERSRRAIEVAEQYAEGQATKENLRAAGRAARAAPRLDASWVQTEIQRLAVYVTQSQPWDATRAVSAGVASVEAHSDEGRNADYRSQIPVLRCIFGNPFRPVVFTPAWRTGTARALGEAAYNERSLPDGKLDRQRLAILADALEEAGCPDTDLLSHLRGPGPHGRGCWPVDLLLGKE